MFLQNAGFSAKSTFSKHADELSKSMHSKLILQDKQLQEMSDHGMCLSMHQVKNMNFSGKAMNQGLIVEERQNITFTHSILNFSHMRHIWLLVSRYTKVERGIHHIEGDYGFMRHQNNQQNKKLKTSKYFIGMSMEV